MYLWQQFPEEGKLDIDSLSIIAQGLDTYVGIGDALLGHL